MPKQYTSTGGSIVDGTRWLNDGHGWQRSSDGGKTWQFSYSPEFYASRIDGTTPVLVPAN